MELLDEPRNLELIWAAGCWLISAAIDDVISRNKSAMELERERNGTAALVRAAEKRIANRQASVRLEESSFLLQNMRELMEQDFYRRTRLAAQSAHMYPPYQQSGFLDALAYGISGLGAITGASQRNAANLGIPNTSSPYEL